LSAKSYYQGDCKLFRTKSLTEHYFMDQLGRGIVEVLDLTEFQKKWIYPTPDSVSETTLKRVCAYAK